MKSISRLTRYLNAYKGHFYPKPPHELPRYKSHNKKDVLGGNWEDEGDLLGKTVTIVTANSIPKTPTKDTPQKRLFASESLLVLRKAWFSRHKFPTGIPILNKKYKHLGSKYKNSFYPFNDQLDYGLAHYFEELETIKGSVNKFLTDPLITPLTKKLSYKNVDK